ncbi:MAG: methyltransferase domain-containing protein [Euzebyales bacterium]|nr:methyltransferase domain-containing protein [Euzebyales bacterium]
MQSSAAERDARVVAWLELSQGDRVLDAGCGGGELLVHLARAVGPSGEVTGADADPDALDAASRTVRAAGVADQVRLVEADLTHGAGIGGFDAVCAVAVVHHLPDPRAGVASLAARCRPGGLLVIGEGGLSPRCLPFYDGLGEPGLESRVLVARDRWFAQMRAAVPGDNPPDTSWPRLLAEVATDQVETRTFLVERTWPLDTGTLKDLRAWFAFQTDTDRARFLTPADRHALGRLLDDDDPLGLARRQDLHLLAASSVHRGRVA